MKTSGFRCKTRFGLLVFLGHPNVPSNPVSQNSNSKSAFFWDTLYIIMIYSRLVLCEYDDFRSWHSLLEGHDDVDEEKMKMSMVMRLTSPIGILAKAYLPSLAIAALLLRRRRKKYCLPGLSWAFMFTIDWIFLDFTWTKSHMVVLKQPKWYWMLNRENCFESCLHARNQKPIERIAGVYFWAQLKSGSWDNGGQPEPFD